MARVVEELPRPARWGRYPWDEWLDGQAWELTRGEDFSVQINTFRRAIYQAARSRELRVITRANPEDNNQIVMQAFPEQS